MKIAPRVGPTFVKTRRTPPAGMITTQAGPKFVKTTSQTGANLGDHTQRAAALPFGGMGTLPAAQVHQLSGSQRSTIRRTVQDAIARHGVEWAMRHTCVELQHKYGLSKDTLEYLLHDELPSALPEELLSANQKAPAAARLP